MVFCGFLGAVNAEAQNATLTITTDGVVSGAVGVQGPGGNVCNPNPGGGPGGGTCTFTYPINTALRIAANSPNPDPGFIHGGTGDASACANSTCNIVLTTDSSILVTFDASQGQVAAIQVSLMGDGKGNVGEDNSQCQNFELGSTACTTYYAVGSEVRLQGRSMPGNIFANFSGGIGDTSVCGGNSLCQFTATGNSSVNANFFAMTSVAMTPLSQTINVGNNFTFNARATFTNGMTRNGSGGMTPWFNHVPMDVARFSLAAAVVGDRYYAIGGVDGACPSSPCAFGPLNTVEVFNPLVIAIAQFEQAWTPRASMSIPRSGLAAVAVNNQIYAIGGFTSGGGAVASMEVYDPPTNAWSPRASMGGARANIAAAAINNTIYVVGGSDDAAVPLSTVEAYDTAGNTWMTLPSMNTARAFPAAAAVNGTLYVIGGDGTGSVEAYHPATGWVSKAPMPGGGGLHRAVAIDGLIYAVGGPNGSPGTTKVYNPAMDAWATLGSMPSFQGQFALAVLDGRMFAAGGNLADNTAIRTLSANRPPETTWWSSNSAVGRINNGNFGSVNGVSAGTATISARLVGVDSSPNAVLTVQAGGGGGGGQIFLGIPNQAFTEVGNPNWGCGTFNQNSTSNSYTVTVNYGDGSGNQNLPFQLNPPAGTCSSPGSISKGAFFFNHAYSSPGTFHVTVTVTNTGVTPNQSATGGFDIQVQEAEPDDCAQVITNFTVIGSVPFDTFHVKFFDRASNELLFETDAPFVLPEDAAVPEGQYRIEISVPSEPVDYTASYMFTPSSFIVDAVCGTPIVLNSTVQAIPVEPPTISLTLSPNVIWPPNNKMTAVSATIVATSPDGHATTVELVSVTSDGAGADIAGASIGTDDRAFEVRAKKDSTYTVTYRATDSVTGLSATATATVVVPHDQGK